MFLFFSFVPWCHFYTACKITCLEESLFYFSSEEGKGERKKGGSGRGLLEIPHKASSVMFLFVLGKNGCVKYCIKTVVVE